MASTHHVGQRLSFDSHLCTVRYIGSVKGTQKEWLGVEWDSPDRGKHDGEYQGVKYFSCRSGSKTAASFVRPSRTPDPVQSLTEAIREKYASEISEGRDALHKESPIEISGKIVEKVGFDKIRRQLAQLQDLKIVIVDGLRISYAEKSQGSIKETCPKIVELDLSRNLFESCEEIIKVCRELKHLRVLRLNGNRLSVIPEHFSLALTRTALKSIRDLSLDETLLKWEEVCPIVDAFPTLATLSASANALSSLSMPMSTSIPISSWSLKSLTLDYNRFSSLADIHPIERLVLLEKLYLKGNQITCTQRKDQAKPKFGERLHYIDLSYNDIKSWSVVDDLDSIFPGMTSLRFSHNPIYGQTSNEPSTTSSTEDGYILTLARLAPLKALNFSQISAAERTNAEIFYLSRISKAMATVPESETNTITSQHKRYNELCQLYGEPTVTRINNTIPANYLEARLINLAFYLATNPFPSPAQTITQTAYIPRGFDIYQVKGIIGRHLDLSPLHLRLIWETGEWDPIAGFEDLEHSDDSDDSDGDEDWRHQDPDPDVVVVKVERDLGVMAEVALKGVEGGAVGVPKGRWMRREVELENGTRQLGFWVEGCEARVRVEVLRGRLAAVGAG